MDELEVRPVDGSRWDDLAALFGRAGAENGCWCQYWLLGAGYHQRDRAENRDDLEHQVGSGYAGLLAYRGGRPVGWARVTPRSELAYLTDRFARFAFSDDDPLALPCFFVARTARGSGVMRALIRAAIDAARRKRRALEAYPIDDAVDGATRNRFSGVISAFTDEGFSPAGRLARDRVLVRLDP